MKDTELVKVLKAGNHSWFRERVIEPVVAGRPVLQFGKRGPWVSPIHVHDCARAMVHLTEHGEAGGRYPTLEQGLRQVLGVLHD